MKKFFLCAIVVLLVSFMSTSAVLAKGLDEPAITGHNIQASQDQLKLIQEIYGKDITVGEYLRIVYPDQLKQMYREIPKSSIGTILDVKMKWPSLPASPFSETDNTEQESLRDSIALNIEASNPSADVGGGEVDFEAEISTDPATPITWFSIESLLWQWVDSAWELKSSCSNWNAVFFSSCKCEGTYETDEDDLYFNSAVGSWYSLSLEPTSGSVPDSSSIVVLYP